MEQIDVVKKGSMAWLWIVIALAAVAIVLWVMMSGDNTPNTTGQIFDGGVERVGLARVLTA